MVIYKTFSEKLVKDCDENKCVRRIMCMDDIEVFGKEDAHREKKTEKHGPTVFPNVGEKTIGIRWRWIPVNAHSIHCFAERLSLVDRTDNGYVISGCTQRVGFLANSQVFGVRAILQEHSY